MTAVTDLDLAALKAASLNLLGTVPSFRPVTVWLSGSLVEGLGNPSSDVDLYAAVDGGLEGIPMTRKASDHGILGKVQDNIRFDLEFWLLADIDRLSLKLSTLPIDDPSKNNLHYLEYWESEFIHRLLVGIPIIEEFSFETLKLKFDAKRYARFLMDTAVRRADDAFDDTIGMQRAGDMRSGALRARDAVGFSIDALIHAHGQTNDREKFRMKKLQRLATAIPHLTPHVDRLWEIERAIPNGVDGQGRYIEEALRYSSELVDMAQNVARQHTSNVIR